jgi:transcriptional regulator with XRE-family HTH domain
MENSDKHYRSSLLQQWMKNVGITSYQELSRLAQISERQLYRLENGLLDNIPLGILQKIATSLNISLFTLIDSLSGTEQSSTEIAPNITTTSAWEYQQEVISILESLILQLPTLIYVVEKNPNLPANKLIPLLQPLNELLCAWEIKPIGHVGEIIPYNPQEHQLIENNDLEIEKGQLVKIRYVGYRHEDKLLYRAKVSSNLEQ